MTDKPFAGKLALVTGASRGIGTAIAEALGRTGAHVIITARTSGGLEEVEERIHAAGGSATIAPRSEEHTSELQSLMRISSAVFCLTKKKTTNKPNSHIHKTLNNST